MIHVLSTIHHTLCRMVVVPDTDSIIMEGKFSATMKSKPGDCCPDCVARLRAIKRLKHTTIK